MAEHLTPNAGFRYYDDGASAATGLNWNTGWIANVMILDGLAGAGLVWDNSNPKKLAVQVDGSTIEISGDTLRVKDGLPLNSAVIGQISGGTAPGASLILDSTTDATKGSIILAGGGGNVGIGATTFGGSAGKVLALGMGTAPTSSPADTVQLWCADRGGTAGKASLHLRTEDGTSHVFGDRVGIGTTNPGAYMFNVAGQSSFGGSVFPSVDGAYDLGSSSLKWASLNTRSITMTRTQDNATGTTVNIASNNNYSTTGTYYCRGIVLNSYINPNGDQTAHNNGYDRGVQITHFLRENAGTLAEVTGMFIEYGSYGPAGADVAATITLAQGIRVTGQKVASTTVTTNYGIRIDGTISGTTAYGLYIGPISGTTTYGIYQAGGANVNYFAGNISLGASAFGTSAAKVFGVANGTAPSTAPADMVQLWSEDINGTNGKAGLHMLAESGTSKLVVVGTIIKTTTGDPSQVHEGLMCINTADKTLKMYCGGAWRSLATWV